MVTPALLRTYYALLIIFGTISVTGFAINVYWYITASKEEIAAYDKRAADEQLARDEGSNLSR